MTKLNIVYVTDETVEAIRFAEIIKNSRTDNTVWVCDPAHFSKILWNGLPADDLVNFRIRIKALGLAKVNIGITDRDEIWVFAGTDLTEVLKLIIERNWKMLSDASTGKLQDTNRLVVLHHTNATLTRDQTKIATFIMETLTKGMTVGGVEHWFVTTIGLTGRKVYSYCEGDTTLTTLPEGWDTVDIMELVTGGRNAFKARSGGTEYTGHVDETTMIFEWLNSEAVTAPGTKQPTTPNSGI